MGCGTGVLGVITSVTGEGTGGRCCSCLKCDRLETLFTWEVFAGWRIQRVIVCCAASCAAILSSFASALGLEAPVEVRHGGCGCLDARADFR